VKHADLVIQRIVVLEGGPNLADYDRILVGATSRDLFENDLALEHAALSVLRPGVALCLEIGDHGTRDLLEKIVVDEEHHIDWIEAQRHKVGETGYRQYLAQQICA
jgi:bacterioferritin